MIKIVHVITGLTRGGAEKMLAKLVTAMDRTRFLNIIVSLTDKNFVGADLERSGFTVHAMGMRRSKLSFWPLLRLNSLLAQERPDIVQTWLYHGDLIGGLVAKLGRRGRIAWNVRNSLLDRTGSSQKTVLTMRTCALLSSFVPDKIIFCSENSRKNHVSIGYCERKIEVIPNGIDLTAWAPSAELRARLRAELNIPEGSVVVGHVARFHPQKDHVNFLRAALLSLDMMPNLRFVLCGDQIDSQNRVLMDVLGASNRNAAFTLLGPRDDIHRLMHAFDIICSSSSFGEAFPNVLLEGMACGVPGVTTDVGDSSFVVGDSGLVVPIRNAPALASALVRIAQMGSTARNVLRNRARERAVSCFDIKVIAGIYEKFYLNLLGQNQMQSRK